MKYMSHDLREEYDRLTKENPDIKELEYPYINISDTLRAYFILADYFTDPSSECVEKMLVGVRDFNLLGSALGRQVVSYGGKVKYTDSIMICSTLFYGMVKNHSFSDGNKRTALLILLYQLGLYGYMPNAKKKSFEKLVVAVAADTIPIVYEKEYKRCSKKDDPIIETIACLIRKMVKKKDNTYHVDITMKDFCKALEKQGIICVQNGTTMHFEREIKYGFFRKNEVKRYAIPFAGWTRIVGAEKARCTLKYLGLYNEFPDYKSFLEGKDPMYMLVDDFKDPLRRLKDK